MTPKSRVALQQIGRANVALQGGSVWTHPLSRIVALHKIGSTTGPMLHCTQEMLRAQHGMQDTGQKKCGNRVDFRSIFQADEIIEEFGNFNEIPPR